MNKFFLVFLLFVGEVTAHQTLQMSPHKRLAATIATSAMNRLTVNNDRIAQIFGDEGSFVSQSDETTGQIFIKPTPENGTQPLSITLITENGLTQDLTLKPTDIGAQTIVLQGTTDEATEKSKEKAFDKALPLQENLIALSKRAILGELSPVELQEPPQRVVREDTETVYQHSYQAGSVLVHVFTIKNSSQNTITLQEKFFYQPGNVSLALKELVLEPDMSTILYVVQRS